jgi:hypothetical protein
MLCAGALPLVRGFHACALVLERQHRQQTLSAWHVCGSQMVHAVRCAMQLCTHLVRSVEQCAAEHTADWVHMACPTSLLLPTWSAGTP